MPYKGSRIVKRVGFGQFGGWAGVNRQSDPGSIGQNQFWALENARWAGGAIVERGGQEKLNTSTLAGGELINGIYDSAFGGTGVGGWGGGGGGGTATGSGAIPPAGSGSCPIPQPTVGDGIKFYSLRGTTPSGSPPYVFQMMFFDNEKYPSDSGGGVAASVFPIPYQASNDPMYGSGTYGLENVVYGGKIYHFIIGSGPKVRVGVMAPCYGDVRIPSSYVFDVSSYSLVGGFVIWKNRLYFDLFHQGLVPKVFYYDGAGVTTAITPTLAGLPASAVVASACTTFGGKVWQGFSNSHVVANTYYPQKIVSDAGDSVTIGAVKFGLGKGYLSWSGTYTARQSMVEFKGKLYLGGQRETPEGPAIYSYDSSGTVAVARDLSGVGPTPAGQWTSSGVYTMWVWNGYLWFLYNTRAGSVDSYKLGKFDGTTWTNDVSATGILGFTRAAEYKGGVVIYGNATGMKRSTDGVTWADFGAAPGGGNPNNCNVAVLDDMGCVL